MRLQRVGRKHEPSFRLVLTDSKNSSKSGKFNEILGSYDPRKSTDSFKTDRIKHWLSKGISATGTVHNLLVTHKLIDAKKVNVLPKKTPIVKAPEPVVEVPKAEVKAEPVVVAEEAVETVVESAPELVTEEVVETPVAEETPVPAEVVPEVAPEAPTEEVVQ